MPVEVIDLLEIVQIEIDQRDIFPGFQLLLDYFADTGAVPQAGGIILHRDNLDFPLGIVRDLRLPGKNL